MEGRERLLREVSLMLTFSHPNIMPLTGLSLDQEMPLIIMPFMSKGSLLQYVRKQKESLFFKDSEDIEQVTILSLIVINTQ